MDSLKIIYATKAVGLIIGLDQDHDDDKGDYNETEGDEFE